MRHVIVCGGNNPVFAIFRWSDAGFGQQLTPPGSITSSRTGKTLHWSPDGNYVSLATSTANGMFVYPINDSTWGSLISPASFVNASTNTNIGVQWTPDGKYIVHSSQVTPFLGIYPWNNGVYGSLVLPTGGQIPSSLQQAEIRPVKNANGTYCIAVGLSSFSSSAVLIYNTDGSSWPTPIQLTTPSTSVFSLCWSPDGKYLFMGQNNSSTSPKILAWEISANGDTSRLMPTMNLGINGTTTTQEGGLGFSG